MFYGGWVVAWAADGARLYPDVALRYTVGDPQARNPINITEGPKTLAAADMKDKLARLGTDDTVTETPEAFRTLLLADIAKYAKVIKAANLKVD
mgnify:CR=1 FL=1